MKYKQLQLCLIIINNLPYRFNNLYTCAMYPRERRFYKIHSYNRSQQDIIFLIFILIYTLTVHHQEAWYCICHTEILKWVKLLVCILLLIQYQTSWWWAVSLSETCRVYVKVKLRNSAPCCLQLYEYITMQGPQNVKVTRYTAKHLTILLLTKNFREDGQIKLRSTIVFIV